MNISFFLKPKVEVSYLTESCPVQKAIDDMLHSGFTAIPVVDAKGKYAGTITEGDFLRLVLHYPKETLEQLTVGQVELRVHHRSVSIDARMEDMVDLVTAQNFVPVVDGRGIFCGIVTRRDVITYLCKQVQIQRSSSRYVSSLSGCPTTAREAFERSNTRRARFRISSAVTRS